MNEREEKSGARAQASGPKIAVQYLRTEKAKTYKHKQFRATLGGLCRAVTVASAVFGRTAVTLL